MPLQDLENLKLTFAQRKMISLYGRVYIGHHKRPEWMGSLPFYAFRCPKHGYVANYPHGFDQRLECPECMKE